MRTNTRVHFGLYDVTARADSTPSCAAAWPWADAEADLKAEQTPALPKYGTLESRQFLMDGSFTLFPDEPAGRFWGLWSAEQSDARGRFAAPPVLNIGFTQPHSSAGFTLHFYPPTSDWASELTIQWFTANSELLATAVFRPDAVDYYCARKVENYSRVSITFAATNRPGRYLKLTGIDYGVNLTFEGQEVVKANVLEEVDLLSNEVRINTLGLTLHNKDGLFSILNPDGVFSVLQHKQKFTVFEEVRADARAEKLTYNMGSFYLSEWRNESDTLAEFTATDAVGLLDGADHMGGVYDTTAAELAADILNGYDYDLAPELAAMAMRGWLPIGTRRSALQQLAFAIGAVVDCSRGDKIRLYPPPTRPSSHIGASRKWLGSKVELKPLVTGVIVTAHQYLPGTQVEELFRGELLPGLHQIIFGQPASGLECTGGAIEASGHNYANVQVESEGEVVITGRKYAETTTTVRAAAENLPANAQANLLRVDNATLVGPGNAAAVARRVVDYYAKRCTQEFKMLAAHELLADTVILDTFGGERLKGAIERMEFDLTGGYVASTKLVGARLANVSSDQARAGEIYTGERSVI